MSDYWRLRKDLEKHPGYIYMMRRESFFRSINIFGGNFSDLAGLIDKIEDPNVFYAPKFTNSDRDKLQSGIIRLLHNYLSAAYSLVDHTRRYIRKWHSSDSIGQEYNDKVDAIFKNNKASSMIKDLRNYLLHRGLPPSTVETTFKAEGNEPPTVKVLFKVQTLLEWSKWSSSSKQYMADKGSYVELRELIKEYQNLVAAFYQWLGTTLDKYHKEELDRASVLIKQVIEIEKSR